MLNIIMFKFIFKIIIVAVILYIIVLAYNNSSIKNNEQITIIERSCSYIPNICYNSKKTFYKIGTKIRNILYKLYILSDKYLTENPIEQQNN